MDREAALKNSNSIKVKNELEQLHHELSAAFKTQFDRSLPFTDEVFDRWEKAKSLGWGEESSIYDSAYIFGDVKVGNNTWIGPFTIIDGSGELTIGDNCTISSGVHIYTHDNVKQTLSGGKLPIERKPVQVGSCTYIAPQSIITMGINLGKHCLVASNSFVNKSFPDYSIIAGNPAVKIGTVIIEGNEVRFEYHNDSK